MKEQLGQKQNSQSKPGQKRLLLAGAAISFCLATAGGLFLIWKMNADNDPIEQMGLSDSGEVKKGAAGGPDAAVSGNNSNELLTESRGSESRAFKKQRSPLIDMAITRAGQIESMLGSSSEPSAEAFKKTALSLDLNESDSESANSNLEKTEQDLSAKLAEIEKAQTSNSAYAAEAEMLLAIIKARQGKSAQSEALLSADYWMEFSNALISCSDPKKADTNLKALYGRYKQKELLKWSFDLGEILAMLLWGYRQDPEAKQVVRKMVELDSKLPKDPLDTGRRSYRLLTLARLLASQNDYVEAKNLIAKARTLAAGQYTLGILHSQSSQAACLLEESRLSLSQRDFLLAADKAQQALTMVERAKDLDTTKVKALKADALELLAKSLSIFPAKLSLAIEKQQECLNLRQQDYGKDGLFTQATALDLCRMIRQKLTIERKAEYVDSKNPLVEKTRSLLEEILAVCARSQKSDKEILRADRNAAILLPQAYLELGFLDCSCGKFADARKSLEMAANLSSKFEEPSLIPFKTNDLDALAALNLKDGRTSEARKQIMQSSKWLNQYVLDVLPQLSLSEQIAFTNNIERHMNSLLSVSSDDGSFKEIYNELIHWKGFLIEQFRLRSAMLRTEHSAAMSKLLSKHQSLSSGILSSYVSGDSETKKFKDAQSKKEEIERRINAQTRNQQDAFLNLSLSQLQSKLASNEALLDLYEFSGFPWDARTPHYGAAILSSNKLSWIDLGKCSSINEALNDWRSYGGLLAVLPYRKTANRNASANTNTNSTNDISDTAQKDPWTRLSEALSDPISKRLPAGVDRVWLSDESELSRLPWSVIFSQYGSSRAVELSQVDSPRELYLLKSDRVSSGSKNDALLIGGIDYSKHDPPAPPLEHALSELKAIRKELESAGKHCIILSESLPGKKPTAEQIMSALPQCRTAHIVTHGFFKESQTDNADSSNASSKSGANNNSTIFSAMEMPTRNPLIESGILVSLEKGKHNGFMTAEDLLDADLSGCKLLVLSACETARGRELSGQGVMGLRSSLMGAGSRSLLLSLWPVPDRPSSKLMQVFYKSLLAGKTPVLALKEAQAAVRSNPEWQAPYYWAAWVLVGDGWSNQIFK